MLRENRLSVWACMCSRVCFCVCRGSKGGGRVEDGEVEVKKECNVEGVVVMWVWRSLEEMSEGGAEGGREEEGLLLRGKGGLKEGAKR